MRKPCLALIGAALVASPAAGQLEITCSLPGAFTDISATGTSLNLADEGVVEIAPGFDLTATLFAGDGSGRVWVSNNGAVGFLGDGGSSGAFYLNTTLPNFGLFGGAHGIHGLREIHPGQVCAFRPIVANCRHVLRDILLDELVIVVEIGQQLVPGKRSVTSNHDEPLLFLGPISIPS